MCSHGMPCMLAADEVDLEAYMDGVFGENSREWKFCSPPPSPPSPPSAPPPDSKKDKKNKKDEKSKKDKKDKKGTNDKKTAKKSKKYTKDKKKKKDAKCKKDKTNAKDNMNAQLPGLTPLQQMQHDDHVQWEIDTKKLEANKRDPVPAWLTSSRTRQPSR
jgi:hypothetical protein